MMDVLYNTDPFTLKKQMSFGMPNKEQQPAKTVNHSFDQSKLLDLIDSSKKQSKSQSKSKAADGNYLNKELVTLCMN